MHVHVSSKDDNDALGGHRIVLANNESLSARAACRAVHIKESCSVPVEKLASKVRDAIRKALEAPEQDSRDGV